MRKQILVMVLPLCLVIPIVVGTTAYAQTPPGEEYSTSNRPVYKTADELRKACEPFLNPSTLEANKLPTPPDTYMLFIVPYLDS